MANGIRVLLLFHGKLDGCDSGYHRRSFVPRKPSNLSSLAVPKACKCSPKNSGPNPCKDFNSLPSNDKVL